MWSGIKDSKPEDSVQGKGWAIGIPKIPEDFIYCYINRYNGDAKIERVWLMQDSITNTRNHTEKYQVLFIKTNADGSVIWKLKEEILYTRDEVRNACIRALGNLGQFDEWFDKYYAE